MSGKRVPKKMVIENFHPLVTNETFDMQKSWDVLKDAVVKMRKKEKANASYEELYVLVQTICQFDNARVIFDQLKELILDFAKESYNTLVDKLSLEQDAFLEELEKQWSSFCADMTKVRSIFIYMDQANRGFASNIFIWEFSLEAFRTCVVDTPEIRSRTVKAVLSLIKSERDGNKVPRHLIKSVLRMFIDLQIYETLFESEFLKASRKLYESEGKDILQRKQVPEYLRHVARRIEQEEERIQYYLDPSTREKLIDIVDATLIVVNIDQLLAKGSEVQESSLDILLKENRLPELTLFYKLLSRTKSGQLNLKNAFAAYIKAVGHVLVSDESRDDTLVKDLMNFKANLDTVINTCFNKNEKFSQALKDAFDYFIATRPNKPAELIAKFMDMKLRTGNKECSDDELEVIMDKVIVLFRFIQGKDVFEAFYKKDLAKRLLLGRSASVDAEKAMLSKLKNECGAAFTQKLEGMFKDMEVSREFSIAFKQHIEQAKSRGDDALYRSDFNVNILTASNWPSYSPMEVNVPPELSSYLSRCMDFYVEKHSGRKLTWQHSLGSAILKAEFQTGVVKELEMSLFQAMVLFLFNKKLQYSFDEIFNETHIEEVELKRTLQSLACGKHRVLHKQPKGKDVNKEDKFLFNEDFTVHLHRIRISQVQMRETEAEHKQTETEVFQDRQYQIDAAIVRTMKQHKKLAHNVLMSELFNQLRFPAKSVDLKKRIESLIERDYVSRDKDDTQLYHYVS